MTRRQLIQSLIRRESGFNPKVLDLVVRMLLEQMSQSLAKGERIEIRGFGSFKLRYLPQKLNGINPKSGERIPIPGKHTVYFRMGKELRTRINSTKNKGE
jgi:integration host factor subunit beta